ncbi:MAG: type II toxin-antitoxin system VapC family toxin [Gemmatimonadaceae bacterium]|nr:type II toxin-antitoxin system VapC family toxin [Gloeobacterales cyanobacterium ES-bin-141]
MKVLLDTCAVSDYNKPLKYPALVAFVDSLPDEALFVSVLTLGEIVKGIDMLPQGLKKDTLQAWYAGLLAAYSDRILPVDPETAEVWGRITSACAARNLDLPAVDGLIAATALQHGLAVLTRNEKHFRQTGAVVVNPWSA